MKKLIFVSQSRYKQARDKRIYVLFIDGKNQNVSNFTCRFIVYARESTINEIHYYDFA